MRVLPANPLINTMKKSTFIWSMLILFVMLFFLGLGQVEASHVGYNRSYYYPSSYSSTSSYMSYYYPVYTYSYSYPSYSYYPYQMTYYMPYDSTSWWNTYTSPYNTSYYYRLHLLNLAKSPLPG